MKQYLQIFLLGYSKIVHFLNLFFLTNYFTFFLVFVLSLVSSEDAALEDVYLRHVYG